MARYRVTISSTDREAMLDLVRRHVVEIIDHGRRPPARGVYAVNALVQGADIAVLEAGGYKVQRHEDVDDAGKQRQREVGRGNRYLDRPQRPETGPTR